MAIQSNMSHEYRLVVERPEYQQGKRHMRYRKQSLADAERALQSHQEHAQRMYEEVGLTVWEAWIETRDVSEWRRLDDEPVEAVPI